MTNVITKKRSSLEKDLAGGLVSCYMRAKKEGLAPQIKKKQSKYKFGEPNKPIIINHFDYDSDSDFDPSDDDSDGSEVDEQQQLGDSQMENNYDEDLNQEIIDLNLDDIMIDPTEDEVNNIESPVTQRQKRGPVIDYYMLANNCGRGKK